MAGNFEDRVAQLSDVARAGVRAALRGAGA
jgi:hypothetical protein